LKELLKRHRGVNLLSAFLANVHLRRLAIDACLDKHVGLPLMALLAKHIKPSKQPASSGIAIPHSPAQSVPKFNALGIRHFYIIASCRPKDTLLA
jgi:hypothetical protein